MNKNQIIDIINKTQKNKFCLEDSKFAFKIPKRLLEKIDIYNPKDPILLQFFPQTEEKKQSIDFVKDPTDDKSFKKGNLITKYKNRALLITSNNCAMHCRFCFRKNFPYVEKKTPSFDYELKELEKNKDLTEIILSGGDPLSLDNKDLEKLLVNLTEISHIQRIRIHTRYIVGYPERIDTDFLNVLKKINKQIIFVFHINHKNELGSDVYDALKKIAKLGIPLLSQTVLLKNINDHVETLLDLFETLSNNGIIPYYLHQLDQVSGSAHFKTPLSKGKKIMEELQNNTSGYNVPKYVQDIPNKTSKTLIF